jgi:hypothetical protein
MNPRLTRLRVEVGRALGPSRRRRLALARVRLRQVTARARLLPSFLVIGTQRGGTSSLYRYLAEHPDVAPPIRKEVEYFTTHWTEGLDWYRAHFPLAVRSGVTFEASPNYLFHPYAPARAAQTVPGARLVVLLRDPIDRAWSHHQHMRRLGLEDLAFTEAVAREAERTRRQPELCSINREFRGFLRFSYLARGRYAEQLQRWWRYFPRHRMLVLRSDELYDDPAAAYGRLLDFLDLPAFQPASFRNWSYRETRTESHAPPEVRREVEPLLRGSNELLAAMLGPRFVWDEGGVRGQLTGP